MLGTAAGAIYFGRLHKKRHLKVRLSFAHPRNALARQALTL
jgi:hypothetical protein